MNRRVFLSALAASALLAAGCVSTQVTSQVLSMRSQPVERVALLVATGSFSASNIAGSLGQRNLDNLAPHLQARLPAVFSLNGIAARGLGDTAGVQPGESLLLVTPLSATYNSRTGQTLVIRAELRDRVGAPGVVWRADVHLATMGFGSFDDKLADDIAVKLLERLRSDRVARLPQGEFRLPPPAPAASSALS